MNGVVDDVLGGLQLACKTCSVLLNTTAEIQEPHVLREGSTAGAGAETGLKLFLCITLQPAVVEAACGERCCLACVLRRGMELYDVVEYLVPLHFYTSASSGLAGHAFSAPGCQAGIL